MTPTPWAQAVEAGEATVRRIANQPKNRTLLGPLRHFLGKVRRGNYDEMTVAEAAFWEAMEARDRAALPHLLRAVTEGMEWERINALRAALAAIPTDGRSNPETYYVEYRQALLSALTAAAGRVDAVTPDPHIGPHEDHIGRSPQ